MKSSRLTKTENLVETPRKRKITITSLKFHHRALTATLAFTVAGFVCGLANAQVTKVGDFTVLTVQNAGASPVDWVNAKPMPLPSNPTPASTTQAMIQALETPHAFGTPGSLPGSKGDGVQSPEFLGTPAAESGIGSEDFGTNDHPFTTVRADLSSVATNNRYPYNPAGRVLFKIGTSTFLCSGSLIQRGIVVIAAHCVANYGASQFYTGWQFAPGYRNGAAPYGTWSVFQAWIKTAYFNGTDGCAVFGIVCPDDVAILILNSKKTSTGSIYYAGDKTGWLGFGWDGFGFTSNGLTQITQLGYPCGLDNCAYMERDDSYGYVNSSDSNNTIIGSNMNGGSSGGPWIINFGLPSALTGETNGSVPSPDIVVGVTSWGYTSTAPKEQGASPFTSNNVLSLYNSACASAPAACSP